MKKGLCLILSLLLLLCFALASCGENENEANTTTAKLQEETTSPDELYLAQFHNLSFNNEEIAFLIGEPGGGVNGTFSERSIGLNDYVLGTNSVDDAVYQRNTKVEDTIKVVISQTTTQGSLTASAYATDLASGTSDYDIVCAYTSQDSAMALKGYVLNYRKLADYNADYLSLGEEHWSDIFTESASYGDTLYWITGDLALRYIGGVYCTFVNTKMYADAIEGKDDGNGGKYKNIYAIVNDQDWTIETLADMSKIVYQDTGNTEGKTDMEDVLGFVVEHSDNLEGLVASAGVNFSEKDPGGNPYITMTTDNEMVEKTVSALNKLLKKDGYAMIPTFANSANSMNMFANDHALFASSKLYQTELFFTNMDNYGVIPNPMADKSVGAYRAYLMGGVTSFGIYAGAENVVADAVCLELMAYYSYTTVTPAYYDMALKYRYTRDEDSAQMIELIRASTFIDPASVWKNSGVGFSFSTYINEAVGGGGYIASTLRGYEKTWNTSMDALLEDLEERSLIEDGVQ